MTFNSCIWRGWSWSTIVSKMAGLLEAASYHMNRHWLPPEIPGIHGGVMFAWIRKTSVTKLCLKFIHLKSQPYLQAISGSTLRCYRDFRLHNCMLAKEIGQYCRPCAIFLTACDIHGLRRRISGTIMLYVSHIKGILGTFMDMKFKNAARV